MGKRLRPADAGQETVLENGLVDRWGISTEMPALFARPHQPLPSFIGCAKFFLEPLFRSWDAWMKKSLLSSLLALLCACPSSPTADETPKRPQPASTPKEKPADAPAPTKSTPERKTVVISAVGDILPHGAVKASADRHNLIKDGKSTNHGGYDSLFDLARVGFSDADIGFANLETPIAPKNELGTRSMVFNAPIDMVEALKHFNATVLSFANNHVYDQGRKGFIETIDNLEASGVVMVGSGRSMNEAYSARVVEKNGLKICFMAHARLLNGDLNPSSDKDPQVAYIPYGKGGKAPKERMLKAIREAKPGCDFLLMSIHWGIEYDAVPHGDDRAWAKEQLEAGVDGILGHHPHVLQPLEEHTTKDGRRTFVSFSFGNFVSNQTTIYPKGAPPAKTGNTRDSMILRVTVKAREDGKEGPQGVLEQVGFYPAWTDRDARPDEENVPAPPGAPDVIRAIVIDKEIEDAQKALDALAAKATLTEEEKAAQKTWKARLDLFSLRRKEMCKILDEKYILPLPPSR